MKRRMADIAAIACDVGALKMDVLMGPSRKGRIPRMRHACYLIAKESGYSYPQIGKFFGGRDHSTIINGVKRAEDLCAHRPEYKAIVERIRALSNQAKPFVADRLAAVGAQPAKATWKRPKAIPIDNDLREIMSAEASMRAGSKDLLEALRNAQRAA